MLATPTENTSPSKHRLRLIGIWVVAFLLFQLLFIYLLSALMFMRVESGFKQIATFPLFSQKQYAASYGLGQAIITATYLLDKFDEATLWQYEQQPLQNGWRGSGQGIFYCCGVSWWYEKEGLVAIVDFRGATEINVSVTWGLSPMDTTTRIAAGLDILVMLALLAMWRTRVRRTQTIRTPLTH